MIISYRIYIKSHILYVNVPRCGSIAINLFLLYLAVSKMKKSNSCSKLYDDCRFLEDARDPGEVEKEEHERNVW